MSLNILKLFSKKCSLCAEKDKELAYLRTLVDNLLINKGVSPVVSAAEEILVDTESEKEERALKERGVVRYGD